MLWQASSQEQDSDLPSRCPQSGRGDGQAQDWSPRRASRPGWAQSRAALEEGTPVEAEGKAGISRVPELGRVFQEGAVCQGMLGAGCS